MLADFTDCTHTTPAPMAQDNVACEQWTRNPHNHAISKSTSHAPNSLYASSTQGQLSDILTKPLAAPAHKLATGQLMGYSQCYSKLAQTSAPTTPFDIALHAARTTPHRAVPLKMPRTVQRHAVRR